MEDAFIQQIDVMYGDSTTSLSQREGLTVREKTFSCSCSFCRHYHHVQSHTNRTSDLPYT